MNRQSWTLSLIVCSLTPLALSAQDAAPNNPSKTIPINGPQVNVLSLADRVTQLEQQMQTVVAASSNQEDQIRQLAQSVGNNGDAIRGLLSRVSENDNLIRQLLAGVESNSLQLRDIAKADGSGGYYPNLLGNMQKPSFRQDLKTAIESSGAATQGKLMVYNPGPYEQIIYINGARWRAIVGNSYVWVPLGSVSVTHYGGITPPQRNDWVNNNGVYELTYDFRYHGQ